MLTTIISKNFIFVVLDKKKTMDIVKGFEMLDVTCTPQVTDEIKTVLGYPEITVNRMYFLIFGIIFFS